MSTSSGIKAAGSVIGGVLSARGHMESGKSSYEAGQVEYHQELERGHYEAKVLQRRMIRQIRLQKAKAGASGVEVEVGSPLLVALMTLNDLQEDRAQILRTSAKNAWKLWNAGSQEFKESQRRATGSLLSGITGAF